MHICLTIASLSKSCGGPSTVVQHLSEHLAKHAGVSVNLITLEAESEQPEVLPRDPRIQVIHVPASRGGGFGSRLRKGLEPVLASGNFDVVQDFGLWLPANHAVVSACDKLKIPLVISPSGMLAPWALRHKAWRKRLAWWLYQRKDLSRASVLVGTAEQEIQDIRHLMPGKRTVLIPNGVELPANATDLQQPKHSKDLRKLVFLGRIHPVKGLRNLVAAWNLVRPEGWQCIVAGPNEAGHQQELATLLRSLHLENQFIFPGLLEDERKWELLNEAAIFVLPSFTENFGVVVAEALAAGVPVIATKGAPWAELPLRQCGWWVDIGVDPLAAALREATSLSDPERQAMGRRGRQLVMEKYSWPQIASELLEVYRWVAGKGPQPASLRTKSHE